MDLQWVGTCNNFEKDGLVCMFVQKPAQVETPDSETAEPSMTVLPDS